MLRVIEQYGIVEKNGMDEAFIDITDRVRLMVQSGRSFRDWVGKVYQSKVHKVHAPNRYRPMDMTFTEHTSPEHTQPCTEVATADDSSTHSPCKRKYERINGDDGHAHHEDSDQRQRLKAASNLVHSIRMDILQETGFKVSAGIACSKVVAKLASGLNKPNGQTIIPTDEVESFLAKMNIACLPGVGYKMSSSLGANGIDLHYVHQLVDLSSDALSRKLSLFISNPRIRDKTSSMLYNLARGRDITPVTPRGQQQSITVEDSFPAFSCKCLDSAKMILQKLVVDFVDRIVEECMGLRDENCGRDDGVPNIRSEVRVPRKLAVRWRQADTLTLTASTNMPPQISNILYISRNEKPANSSDHSRVCQTSKGMRHAHGICYEVIIREAMSLLCSKAKFPLTKIALTATKIEVEKGSKMFQYQLALPSRARQDVDEADYLLSKKRQRMLREDRGIQRLAPSNPVDSESNQLTVSVDFQNEELETDDGFWTELAELEDP